MIKDIVTDSNYQDDISKELREMYYNELIKLIEEAGWETYDPDKDSNTCSTENDDKWYQRKSFILKVSPSGFLTIYVKLDEGKMEYLITNEYHYAMLRKRSIDEILELIK
jgi:hypothetical protein